MITIGISGFCPALCERTTEMTNATHRNEESGDDSKFHLTKRSRSEEAKVIAAT
jgi:hypothetical protein